MPYPTPTLSIYWSIYLSIYVFSPVECSCLSAAWSAPFVSSSASVGSLLCPEQCLVVRFWRSFLTPHLTGQSELSVYIYKLKMISGIDLISEFTDRKKWTVFVIKQIKLFFSKNRKKNNPQINCWGSLLILTALHLFTFIFIYWLFSVRWIKAFLTLPDWNSSSIGRCFQQVCSLVFPFHNNQQQMSQRREVKEERFGFTRKHTEKAASWEAQLRAQWAHIQVLFFCFLSHNSLLFVILGVFLYEGSKGRVNVWFQLRHFWMELCFFWNVHDSIKANYKYI